MAREKPAFCKAGGFLLNMSVVGNMVLAVAVIALAPGAVPEFQIGEFGIGSAADGAAVGIGCLGLFPGGGLKAAGLGEGNYLGTGAVAGALNFLRRNLAFRVRGIRLCMSGPKNRK